MKPALSELPPTSAVTTKALRDQMTQKRIAEACERPRTLRSWALGGISIYAVARAMAAMTEIQRKSALALSALRLQSPEARQ